MVKNYTRLYDIPIAIRFICIVTEPVDPDGNLMIPSTLSFVTDVKTAVAAFPPETVLVEFVSPTTAIGVEV
jgi:hypothetical protein